MGGVARVADVLDGFERRVGAHVHEDFTLFRRADPIELAHVVLDFFAAHELIEIQTVGKHGDGQTVGLSDTVDVIRCDHSAGTGHVLHDHFGMSRNVFRNVASEQARPAIVETAGCKAHDDLDRLP